MRHAPTRLARAAAALTAATLATSLLGAPPATGAGRPPAVALTELPPPRSVPGTELPPLDPPPPDQATRRALKATTPPAWPAAATAEVAVPSGKRAILGRRAWARAGRAPVWVAAPAAKPGLAPPRARVQVLGRDAAAKAGIAGMLLRVGRAGKADGPAALSVAVGTQGLGRAYGGDWRQRLRLLRLPDCALSTPGRRGCQPRPLRSSAAAGQVTAQVALPAGTGGVLLALAAAPGGGTGDYAATPLEPSGAWTAGGSGGDFAWSYPLRVPPSPGGLDPTLTLTYTAGSVDGKTAATNNQPSWVGEGWDLWPGFVERSYRSCRDELAAGQPETTDLCWAGDNATLSLGGQATELAKDRTTGRWRARADSGWRVERLTGAANGDDNGEYWKVTDTEGTQYVFGRNRLPGWAAGKPETRSAWTVPVFGNHAGEPCHRGAFAGSWCQQAWRWNLDHVIDPHGNTIAFYYQTETNHYGRAMQASAATVYVRGGTLTRVDYGTRLGQELSAPAPARVLLTVADRCVPGSSCSLSDEASWPDTPLDQRCTAPPCTDKLAPTFWTTKRLATVTTQVRAGGSYRDVDTWDLAHQLPDPGDGTDASLWLDTVTHTGLVGGREALPPVNFDGIAMPNRVDGLEGQPPMSKYRVIAIHSEAGGVLTVNYTSPQCSRDHLPSPDANTLRCFPAWWAPEDEEERLDWFHKYLVASIVEDDRTGGRDRQLEVTSYDYLGAPAWHYDDSAAATSDHRTWSQWRGYERVRVRHGDPTVPGEPQSATLYRYFRGMDGDRLSGGGTRHVTVTDSEGVAVADSPALRGFLREEVRYNGLGGPILDATVNDPWRSPPTATAVRDGITVTARIVRTAETRTRTAVAGGWRRTETRSTFNSDGIVTRVSDLGDVGDPDDDQCTRTTYARNTGAWMLTYASRIEVVGASCSTAPSFPADAVSDTRYSYDGSAPGVPPRHGDMTRVEVAGSRPPGGPGYVTAKRTSYDAYGRPLEVTDALGRGVTTAYTPPSGALATRKVTTNPLGHPTTTTIEPGWGHPVAVVDANGLRTDLAYDPLGRLVEVWLPGRGKASGAGGNLKFSYLVRNNGPVVVTSRKLTPDGDYLTRHELFDGRLRPRQTQAEATGGGRVVTDTLYDSRGLVVRETSPYHNAGAPGTALLQVDENLVPGETVTRYDGAERPVAEVFKRVAIEQWRTTKRYGGDRVHVDPPAGGIATTAVVDARGRTVELRQYEAGSPSGDYGATRYTYGTTGALTTITGPAGNQWRYTYDLRGNRVRATHPDTGTTTSTYDDAGQLVASTDARGRTVAYTYDDLGRKTGVFEGSPGGTRLAAWTYDTLLKGKLTSATRLHDGSAYTVAVTGYDSAGRPEGRAVTIPATEGPLAGTYRSRTTYRADGSVASVTYPAAGGLPAETVFLGYDDLGRPSTLGGLTTYVAESRYTAIGQPQRFTLDVGLPRVWMSYFYEDGTGRLARIEVDRESSGAEQARIAYTYDPAGNVTRIADTPRDLPADVQCLRYDHLRRLTQAWTTTGGCAAPPSPSVVGGPAPYWHEYAYDAAGNRLALTEHGGAGATTTSLSYREPGEPQPHAVRAASTSGPRGTRVASYDYDPAGNTIRRETGGAAQQLAWDAEGRLASVSGPDGTSSYVYDAEGRRLLSRDPEAVTLFLGAQELRHDRSTGRVTATRFYRHGGTTVAARTPSGLTWTIPDRQGTAQLAVNATTLQVSRRRLDPFGRPRGDQPAWPDRHGFAGGTMDPTGLTHLGAREYDPSSGRFASADPVVDPLDPQQLNAYAYANNNPTSFSDPTGMLVNCGPDGFRCGMSPEYDRNGRPRKRSAPAPQPRRPRPWHRQPDGGAGPGTSNPGGLRVVSERLYPHGTVLQKWSNGHAYVIYPDPDIPPVLLEPPIPESGVTYEEIAEEADAGYECRQTNCVLDGLDNITTDPGELAGMAADCVGGDAGACGGLLLEVAAGGKGALIRRAVKRGGEYVDDLPGRPARPPAGEPAPQYVEIPTRRYNEDGSYEETYIRIPREEFDRTPGEPPWAGRSPTRDLDPHDSLGANASNFLPRLLSAYPHVE